MKQTVSVQEPYFRIEFVPCDITAGNITIVIGGDGGEIEFSFALYEAEKLLQQLVTEVAIARERHAIDVQKRRSPVEEAKA